MRKATYLLWDMFEKKNLNAKSKLLEKLFINSQHFVAVFSLNIKMWIPLKTQVKFINKNLMN